MFHLYISWKFLALFFVSSMALAQSAEAIPVATVLDVLAVLFLAVGIVAFLRLRRLQDVDARSRARSGQTNMGQLRAAGVALPTFLTVPVVILLVVWLGASNIIPSPPSPLSPTPTHGGSGNTAITPPAQNPLEALIDQDLVKHGVLTVGTDPSYPPQTSLASGTNTGSDIDIITAMAQEMGLTPHFVTIPYQNLASSLDASKVDVVISAYSINDVNGRHFVPYLNPVDVLLVPKTKAKITQFTGLSDLCGYTISVLTGSSENAALTEASKKCPQGQPLTIDSKGDLDSVITEVMNGSADASFQDSPTSVDYLGKYGDQVQPLGKGLQGSKEVILIRKGDSKMNNAIQDAFNLLVEDNSYCSVLQKWQLTVDQLPPDQLPGHASCAND